jgi:hypothetical protein
MLGRWGNRLELLMVIHQSRDHLEVVFHVGPRVYESSRLQNSGDLLDEFIGENATSEVFSFPPGVWKVDMHGRDRRGGHISLKGDPDIAAQDANVRQFSFFEAFGPMPSLFVFEFNTEEIDLRMSRPGIHKEHSASTTDVNFHRIAVSEESFPVDMPGGVKERTKIVPGQEIGKEINWWLLHRLDYRQSIF